MAQTIPHPTARKVHSLLSSRSEECTSVVHSYCLLSARKLNGNCVVFHDEDTKSIHNTLGHDVSYVLSEVEYSGENWKFNLHSKKKL